MSGPAPTPPPADRDEATAERQLPDGADVLVREEPLLIAAGGGRVLTMRTPGQDRDLALGFLLSEGAVQRPDQVRGMRSIPGDPSALRPDTIEVELDGVDAAALQGRLTRTHEVRASCGICGLADADALLDETPALVPRAPRVDGARIEAVRTEFERMARCFAQTGASHAAGIWTEDGTLIGFGEDVGRHNALDKAIGAAAASHFDRLRRAMVMLSGRAGYDLVLKALRLGIPMVLSVSAPSALAFDLCCGAGATLVGFVRPGRRKVYCDAGRLQEGTATPAAKSRPRGADGPTRRVT